MKNKRKSIIIIASTCVLLTILIVTGIIFHVSGEDRYFEGEAAVYYQSLLDAGFPEDYAVSLTELHLLHPEWHFVPLKITQLDSDYTWDYVIQKETEDESNNLISPAESHIPYRHPFNLTPYDSGMYAASVAAVEYFMDPRNFLNETDIFQFYDFSSVEGTSKTAVEAVLKSTFMENATLDNGVLYADYFMQVGEEVGVNPLYLAVMARQEQGVNGTSPLLFGECGTLLNDYYINGSTDAGAPSEGYTSEELLALDGLYNFFNSNATGNGRFSIYYNALKRAARGTEHMSELWGGSPAWNTLWKSLWGGAYSFKTSYIDRYQNTIYLKKFNVDARSNRNFWGQYMQNVGGALTESRILYSAFASVDNLDTACTFLIPVYAGMPATVCRDPASGSCSYLARADQKYHYAFDATDPIGKAVENMPLYNSVELPAGGLLKLDGELSHSYGISHMEYRWDNGDWIRIDSTSEVKLSLPLDFSPGSSHILTLRGKAAYDHDDSAKKCNSYFLAAVIYVNIEPPPTAILTLQNGEAQSSTTLMIGSVFKLPDSPNEGFMGWYGSDGSFLPGNAEVILREDTVYEAIYFRSKALAGASLICRNDEVFLRFSAAVEEPVWTVLQSLPTQPKLCASVSEGNESYDAPAAEKMTADAYKTTWQVFSADTAALDIDDWRTDCSVTFLLHYTYTDGSTSDLRFTSSTRNAFYVARQVLLDGHTLYSPTLEKKCQEIVRLAK